MKTASPKGAKGKADRLFSQLVRARGACERCGDRDPSKHQCAHIISRRFSATRVVFENAWCLCARCHIHVDENAGPFMELVEQTIGEKRYWELYHRAHGNTGKVDWVAEAAALAEMMKAQDAA